MKATYTALAGVQPKTKHSVSPKDLHGMSGIGFRCDTFAFPILQKKIKLLNFNYFYLFLIKIYYKIY